MRLGGARSLYRDQQDTHTHTHGLQNLQKITPWRKLCGLPCRCYRRRIRYKRTCQFLATGVGRASCNGTGWLHAVELRL